jgi:hypothetical protein
VDIHPLYIDYKQAYNNINRDQFIKIIIQFEIPSKLVRLIQNDNGTNKVIMQGKMSTIFETVVGLRQGNALPTLFTLCMEKVIRSVKANTKTTIFHRTRKCLLYADDVVLLGYAVTHTAEI